MQKKNGNFLDTGVFNQNAAHLISRGPCSNRMCKSTYLPREANSSRRSRTYVDYELGVFFFLSLSNYKLNRMHIQYHEIIPFKVVIFIFDIFDINDPYSPRSLWREFTWAIPKPTRPTGEILLGAIFFIRLRTGRWHMRQEAMSSLH